MNFREIKRLIKDGENEVTEFKKKANFPEKIVKEIVAFANTRGGNLLIGVEDDGRITGTKTAEEDLFVLENAISKYCRPKINYAIDVIRISEKRAVLNYRIFESNNKPHFVIDPGSHNNGKAYFRLEDKSLQASRELVEILKKSRRKAGMKVNLGEKERILMNYLGEHHAITVNEFSKIANIKKYVASKTLVWLVVANILEIEVREDHDIYRQKLATG
jgi:predicted HTH transcriptional regulator